MRLLAFGENYHVCFRVIGLDMGNNRLWRVLIFQITNLPENASLLCYDLKGQFGTSRQHSLHELDTGFWISLPWIGDDPNNRCPCPGNRQQKRIRVGFSFDKLWALVFAPVELGVFEVG